jgi:hypothetical protein
MGKGCGVYLIGEDRPYLLGPVDTLGKSGALSRSAYPFLKMKRIRTKKESYSLFLCYREDKYVGFLKICNINDPIRSNPNPISVINTS